MTCFIKIVIDCLAPRLPGRAYDYLRIGWKGSAHRTVVGGLTLSVNYGLPVV